MISVNGVLLHKVGEVEAKVTEVNSVTVMVPVAAMLPQPPVRGIL